MNYRRDLRRVLSGALLAAAFLLPSPLAAQFFFRQVNLAYLARRADVIVQGRITNVKYEPLPGYQHIPTVLVTLSVKKSLRGAEGDSYTFRQTVPFLRGRADKGTYQVGEELLLFLPSPSQYGLSSPIAHEQGTFLVRKDAQGKAFIANGYDNRGLFKNVQSDAQDEGMTLPSNDLQTMSAAKGPMELDSFVSLVKTLTRLPRIK